MILDTFFYVFNKHLSIISLNPLEPTYKCLKAYGPAGLETPRMHCRNSSNQQHNIIYSHNNFD
jgi:hypothetical protein